MQGYDSPTISSRLYRGILAVKRAFEILKFKYAPDRREMLAAFPFLSICIIFLFFFLLFLPRARPRGRLPGIRDLAYPKDFI